MYLAYPISSHWAIIILFRSVPVHQLSCLALLRVKLWRRRVYLYFTASPSATSSSPALAQTPPQQVAQVQPQPQIQALAQLKPQSQLGPQANLSPSVPSQAQYSSPATHKWVIVHEDSGIGIYKVLNNVEVNLLKCYTLNWIWKCAEQGCRH